MNTKKPKEIKGRKGGLSSDAAIIVTLLKEQPLEKKLLIKKSMVSESSFSRDQPMLLDENVIKMVEGGYALWYYESTIILLEKKFMELQQSNESAVRIGTLANYSGTPPEKIREEAYRLGKQYRITVLEDNY